MVFSSTILPVAAANTPAFDARDSQERLEAYTFARYVYTCYQADGQVETNSNNVKAGQLFYDDFWSGYVFTNTRSDILSFLVVKIMERLRRQPSARGGSIAMQHGLILSVIAWDIRGATRARIVQVQAKEYRILTAGEE
jgi:hypothetical protein